MGSSAHTHAVAADMVAPGPLLAVRGLTVRFGGVVALDRLDFDVQRGSICGLIGPNGAGKSTVFNCISRIYPCREGAIHFDGHSMAGMKRDDLAGIGVGRTFQNLALFRTMTVRENVLVGCHGRKRWEFTRACLGAPGESRDEALRCNQVAELLEYVGLTGDADRCVADLPFGTQKRVELARALATRPKLLLLDEPACGLNHEEVAVLGRLIQDIRDRFQLTVLLVEHHMPLVMGICDDVIAINFGRKIAEGKPADIARHPAVVEAYLGAADEQLA